MGDAQPGGFDRGRLHDARAQWPAVHCPCPPPACDAGHAHRDDHRQRGQRHLLRGLGNRCQRLSGQTAGPLGISGPRQAHVGPQRGAARLGRPGGVVGRRSRAGHCRYPFARTRDADVPGQGCRVPRWHHLQPHPAHGPLCPADCQGPGSGRSAAGVAAGRLAHA